MKKQIGQLGRHVYKRDFRETQRPGDREASPARGMTDVSMITFGDNASPTHSCGSPENNNFLSTVFSLQDKLQRVEETLRLDPEHEQAQKVNTEPNE